MAAPSSDRPEPKTHWGVQFHHHTNREVLRCSWGPPYLLAVVNVFKHVDAVVDDGLQDLLVVVCTPADLGQVGQNGWQQVLMMLREAEKLTLSTFDLLLDMNPETQKQEKQCGMSQVLYLVRREADRLWSAFPPKPAHLLVSDISWKECC